MFLAMSKAGDLEVACDGCDGCDSRHMEMLRDDSAGLGTDV
jgi:hypothetical protein